MSYTCSIAQSIQATARSMIGEPDGAACQSTSSKRVASVPDLANFQHRSPCSSAQDVHAEEPGLAMIASQVSESFWGRKPTSGGSSDTDVNEPIVKPDGRAPVRSTDDRDPGGEVPHDRAEVLRVEGVVVGVWEVAPSLIDRLYALGDGRCRRRQAMRQRAPRQAGSLQRGSPSDRSSQTCSNGPTGSSRW
jgi:hypothetical protein